MTSRFREPIFGMVAVLLRTYWRPGLSRGDEEQILRVVIDTVQTHVGQQILRDLPHARAYHHAAGHLGEQELLTSGTVVRLVRQATGLSSEPVQPPERGTRR